MSKISTRKGLALGTIVTLGFSALTGIAPAQANDQVTLVPKAGTSYNVPADEKFTLNTYFASAAQSAASDVLKVKIVDSSEKLDLGAGKTAVANVTDVAALDATSKAVVVTTTAATAGVANSKDIVLVPSGSITAKFSVTVQSWVDRDGNSTIDAGEVASQVRTVNFLTKSDITAAITFGETIEMAATDAKATVVFTPGLNLQLLDLANASTTGTASDGKLLPADIAGLNVKLAGTEADNYVINSDGSVTVDENTAVAAGSYTVEAFLGSDSLGKTTATIVDNAPTATSGKSTVALVAGDNATAAGVVRVGSTSHSLKITLKKSDDKAVPAGVLVRLTLDGTSGSVLNSTNSVADTITVGGKSVSASADVAFTAKTDASGQVTLPIVATGGTAGSKIVLDVKSEGVTIVSAFAITWTAATYTLTELTTVDAKDGGAAAGSATAKGLASTVGGTTEIKVAYVDQFGKAPADNAVRVKAVNTLRTASTLYANIVGGRASVNVTDAAVSGQTQIKTELSTESYDTAASSWGSASGVLSTVWINPLAGTTSVIDLTTATTAADLAATISTTALVAADTRVGATATLGSGANIAIVSGDVSVDGALVTISGSSDLVFATDGLSAKGTLSGYADDGGRFKFSVYSNKTGSYVVSVSAPGATAKTATIVFTNDELSGTVVSLAATPSRIGSGKTLKLSATISDKFGNAIDTTGTKVKVTYVGPGLPIGTLPTETDAAGVVAYNYLLGASDTGAATITVEYYGADGADDAAGDTTPDDIIATKTILIGVSATSAAGSKRANVTVKNAEGLTVKVVSGSRSVTRVATSDNFRTSLTKLAAGKRTVKVYVNDILVSSRSVTVRR
jgi:hypothetical protein